MRLMGEVVRGKGAAAYEAAAGGWVTKGRKPGVSSEDKEPPTPRRNVSTGRRGVVVAPPRQVVVSDDDWVEIEERETVSTTLVTVRSHKAEVVLPDRADGMPDVADPMFQMSHAWPEWVKGFREHQWAAIEQIQSAYEAGADLVFLDAPTGSGKTLIGETVRRMQKVRGLYVCSGKTLQDQFVRDFPYASVLKGRSNYTPLSSPDPAATCADCNKERVDGDTWECDHCDEVWACPYGIARRQALAGEVAVVNTTYMLNEANRARGELTSNQELVIVDEADCLEGEVMRFVEFELKKAQLAMLGLDAPKKGVHHKTIGGWMMEELIPSIGQKIEGIPVRTSDVRVSRRRKALVALKEDAKRVAEEMCSDRHEAWIRDNDAGPLVLRPVSVGWAGNDVLWRHSNKWLLMSASIISPQEMVDSLGIDEAGLTWEVVEVPMTFDVENRRVHAIPSANMVAKEKATAWPEMAVACGKVLDLHPRDRVLIHCVSFELGKHLANYLRERYTSSPRLGEMGDDLLGYRDIITYGSGMGERDRAISKYRATAGSVLIGASLDRGVDFKDDDCRVVVVAKVPFPYLGDKQVSARANAGRAGRLWYAVQTVRTLVQMTGRHVRSEDDYGVTYILDSQFVTNIYDRNKSLFPRWWRKAVKVESRRWLDG